MVGTWDVLQILRKRIYRIVHSKHFTRILMVFINNCAASQLGYAHDTVGIVHTVLLDGIDRWIHFSTRTIEIRSMHMNAQWTSTHHLGMYTSRISQPVVCMDNVELFLAGYYTGYNGEVVDLFMQIARITSSKLHTSQVVDMQIREISINMVTISIIFFWRHLSVKTRLQVIVVHIPPYNRNLIHPHNLEETFFIA